MDAKNIEYVVFDVETTGLSPLNGDRVIEIGAIKIKKLEIVESFETFVNPQRELSEDAMRINNITEDMIEHAPTAKEILPDFINFIGGACLVGHNVKFDLDFLCFELAQIGRKLGDDTPALDTLKMAKSLMPHLTSFRLANIASKFGLSIKETHRALADVELTVGVLKSLIVTAENRSMVSFRDMIRQFGVQKPSFKIHQAEQASLF